MRKKMVVLFMSLLLALALCGGALAAMAAPVDEGVTPVAFVEDFDDGTFDNALVDGEIPTLTDKKYDASENGKVLFLGGPTTGYADFMLNLTVNTAMNNWGSFEIAFRVWDNRDWMGYKLRVHTNWLTLEKADGGAPEKAIKLDQCFGEFTGKDLALKIVCKGSKIAVFVDGEKCMEANDATAPVGHIELYQWDAAYSISAASLSLTVTDEDLGAPLDRPTSADFSKPLAEQWQVAEDDTKIKISGTSANRNLNNSADKEDYTYAFFKGAANEVKQDYSARLKLDFAEGGELGLLFKNKGLDGDSYKLVVTKTSMKIVKCTVASDKVLVGAETTALDFDAAETYDFRIACDGLNFKAYVNDELQIDATDTLDGAKNYYNTLQLGSFGISSWKVGYNLYELSTASLPPPPADPYVGGAYNVDFSQYSSGRLGEKYLKAAMKDPKEDLKIKEDGGVNVLAQESVGGETIAYFGSDFSQPDVKQWSDFTLTASIKAVYSHAGWTWGKILFRAQDQTDNILGSANATQKDCYKLNFKSNQVWLSLDEQGVERTIAGANRTFDSGRYYDVKIVCKGEQICVFIGGEKVFDVTDNIHLDGIFGLDTWQSKYYVKNIAITETVDDADLTAAKTVFAPNSALSTDSVDGWHVSSADLLSVVSEGEDSFIKNANAEGETVALFGEGDMDKIYLDTSLKILNAENEGWQLRLLLRSNGWGTNTYYLQLDSESVGIYKNTNDTIVEVGRYAMSIGGDKYYRISLTADRGAFAVSIDGKKVLDVTDTTYGSHPNGLTTMGTSGFLSWNTGYQISAIKQERLTDQTVFIDENAGGDDNGDDNGGGDGGDKKGCGCKSEILFSSGTAVLASVLLGSAVLSTLLILAKRKKSKAE